MCLTDKLEKDPYIDTLFMIESNQQSACMITTGDNSDINMAIIDCNYNYIYRSKTKVLWCCFNNSVMPQ